MTKPQTFPVVEIFGPTIQGEGREVGTVCSFVRFAFCGFSCSWCDSKHSWQEPEYRDMTATEIAEEIRTHYPQDLGPQHVVLTGGDPAIQKHMHNLFYQLPNTRFSIETQGQIFQSWMLHSQVDTVTISPKLSSSGMNQTPEDLADFIMKFTYMQRDRIQVKIVCFNPEDVDEAQKFIDICQFYLIEDVSISSGTVPHEAHLIVIDRYRRLVKYCLKNNVGRHIHNFRILPQQHVIVWGHRQGV